MKQAKLKISVAAALTVLSLAPVGAQTIYSESFSGTHTLLNGVGVEGGTGAGTLWSANGTFYQDGVLDGTVEGSAILPFNPQTQYIYTLSLGVSNTTDRWVGLGFARDPLTLPGGDLANDRFSNETEGLSWMLFRDHATDPLQDIQIFGGLRTGSPIADDNSAITHAQWNELKIVIDTSADLTGGTFLANFFLNDVSILPGGSPVTVNLNIDDINYVGMTYDDATTMPVLVDDFLFAATAVPEPTTAALMGVAGLALLVSRMRRR